MRVLIISGEDLAGGGHRAAFRLHQALRASGVESWMAVRRKHSEDPFVHKITPSELGWPPIGRGYFDMVPPVLLRSSDEPISLGLQSVNLGRLVARFSPDIVNLHWINAGIASIRAVAGLKVPVVWTLHDMWPFTGGCHYSGECGEYRQSCRRCPKVKQFLGAPAISNWIHQRKRKHWGDKATHAITPSDWMKKLALSSSLFSHATITHIRNCVDPAIFNAHARAKMRAQLGLEPECRAVLFSSANQPRKGASIIPDVIRILQKLTLGSRWRFIFMGGVPPMLEASRAVVKLPPTTDQAQVASYYAASDLYVLPSYEDNLPNTISESLSCGTPVAAFPTGGIVEMVERGVNGYLSERNDALSLTDAICQVWTSGLQPRESISSAAHATYAPGRIAALHINLFDDILSGAHTSL